MAIGGFSFYNINFYKKGGGKWVFVQGEIENNTRRDYHAALFRISIFDRNVLMWTGIIKIAGFRKKQIKPFEVFMEGLDYRSIHSISKYEIYFESGY